MEEIMNNISWQEFNKVGNTSQAKLPYLQRIAARAHAHPHIPTSPHPGHVNAWQVQLALRRGLTSNFRPVDSSALLPGRIRFHIMRVVTTGS